jgi:hypothetical protein
MKYLMIWLLLCAAWLPLSAQHFGGGLIVGLNASQIDGDNFQGFNKAGLSIGGFVDYEITKNILFQPEILFDQLGSATTAEPLSKMGYITVPLMLNLTLPISIGNSTQEIQLHAGPAVGFLLYGRDGFNLDITDALKSHDIRALGGVAFLFNRVSLSVRYGYSMISLAKGGRSSILFPLGGPYHNYVNFALRFHILK